MNIKLYIGARTSKPAHLVDDVKNALEALSPNATTLVISGMRFRIGPDGVYAEFDEYLHDYPAWISPENVCRVSMAITLETIAVALGIFVKGDTKACLNIKHAPLTGLKFYMLNVQGNDLAAAQELHLLIRNGNAEAYRTETWDGE